MAGFYIPSNFSANYVANKKTEEGTYKYDSAINQVGIDAQRSMQQLNKQYNMTINQAYGQNLLANRGLRASVIGTGYKEAFAQNIRDSLAAELTQVDLSVGSVKQSIFDQLSASIGQIGQAQQQEINNMRRMASSVEQYNEYLKTLSAINYSEAGQAMIEAAGGIENMTPEQLMQLQAETSFSSYMEDFDFLEGTFEDNYDKLFSTDKGSMQRYLDEQGNTGLAFEDWLRRHGGTSDKDTAWLDWAYGGGMHQYQDFVAPRIRESQAKRQQLLKAKEEADRKAKEEADRKAAKNRYWNIVSGLQGSIPPK